jgi:NAD(P)-dependent dehydrogenase (short-subunit alcohol dehydrogenase family)
MSLSGKVAIITGGGRHLGRAYCLGMARAGATVVAADIIDAAPVAEEIRSEGGRGEAVFVDVTDGASVEALAKFTAERFQRIDVLVNNAGYFKQAQRGRWHEIELDEWERSFAVNVRGVWLCCRAVFPYMKKQQYGKIINIGSNTSWKGTPGFLHYVSAKSAIVGLSRALAREVGDYNICVNTLCPDLTPDEETLQREPERNDLVVQQRVFRRTQTPDDMIGAVTFLAGPGSDFITGQSLLVNGGVWFQ